MKASRRRDKMYKLRNIRVVKLRLNKSLSRYTRERRDIALQRQIWLDVVSFKLLNSYEKENTAKDALI
jgi:hypothetical protein